MLLAWSFVLGAAPSASAEMLSTPATGRDHTCALTWGGGVACWGSNEYGQLGNASDVHSGVPLRVPGVAGATAVAAGGDWTCAVASGDVLCWGDDDYYTYDNGTRVPTLMPGIRGAIAVGVAGDHSCAVQGGGQVFCWGDNSYGQLGDGTEFTRYYVMQPVVGIDDAIGVTVGGGHSCALSATGHVSCWGRGFNGELGDGANQKRPTPVPVVGVTDAIAVTAGGLHSCAVLSSGQVRCWGEDRYGQVGDGAPASRLLVPATVPGVSNAVAASAGKSHTCAVMSSGLVACWGRNDSGQLGDGTLTDRMAPVTVPGITGVHEVAAGAEHTCAVSRDGSVQCWGHNAKGQLGDGGDAQSKSPVPVSGWGGGADAFAPSIDIRVPGQDQHVVSDAQLVPDFSCIDSGASGLRTCHATRKIDTTGSGPRSFAVRATDYAGNTAQVTVPYVVDEPPSPPPPPPAPFGTPSMIQSLPEPVERPARLTDLYGSRSLLRLDGSRSHTVLFRSPGAGVLTIAWRRRGHRGRYVNVASGQRRFAREGLGRVALKLTHSGRRLLATARRHRMKVASTATFTYESGNKTSAEAALTIIR